MSKKVICTLAGAAFAIAIYWLGFVNGVYYNENKTEVMTEENTTVLSVEEALDEYIQNKYGSEYYGVVRNVKDGYVLYDVYSNDSKYSVYDLLSTHVSWIYEIH